MIIEQYYNFWFIIAAILLAVEVLSGFIIIFLFGSVAASVVGVAVLYNVIPSSNLILQCSIFFIIASLLAILAYRPLRKVTSNFSNTNYNNIIGATAEVIEENLIYGKIGKIKWSGTIIKAEIAEDSKIHEIPIGRNVKIVEIKENIFIVKLY